MFRITLLGNHSKSVLTEFEAAGINYEVLRLPAGVVMNSGDLVDFANYIKDHAEHAGWAIAIASVLHSWLKARAGRIITVTMPDHTIYHMEGLSAEDFAVVVQSTSKMMVVDTNKDADSTPTKKD